MADGAAVLGTRRPGGNTRRGAGGAGEDPEGIQGVGPRGGAGEVCSGGAGGGGFQSVLDWGFIMSMSIQFGGELEAGYPVFFVFGSVSWFSRKAGSPRHRCGASAGKSSFVRKEGSWRCRTYHEARTWLAAMVL